MMKYRLTFFIILFIANHVHSVTIEGNEPDYAGRTLKFFTYQDPISKLQSDFFTLKIDLNGNLSADVKVDHTTYCFCSIDVYEGMLVLEPGKDIRIVLPPSRKKTFTEEKNPYFKPLPVWLKIGSGETNYLNNLIAKFESRFNQLTDQYFNQLYFRQSMAVLDTITNKLQTEFKEYSNQFFQKQLKYKLLILEAEVKRIKQEQILRNVDVNVIDFDVPSFIDLVDRIYTNKLAYEVQSVKGAELHKAVSQTNLTYVKEYFTDKYGLKTLDADFILLKLFHDAFYSEKFSQQSILKFLDTSYFNNNKNIEIRNYAHSIKQKLVYLMVGTLAPDICLANIDKVKVCMSQSDKFTYLFFADPEIKVNREHLKYLTKIDEKFKNQLQVYIVLNEDFSETVSNFLIDNKIPGEIVFDQFGEVAKSYRIKAYPTCLLLGKKLEIILSPAKPPLDGFEYQFTEILKEAYIREKRNQQ